MYSSFRNFNKLDVLENILMLFFCANPVRDTSALEQYSGWLSGSLSVLGNGIYVYADLVGKCT